MAPRWMLIANFVFGLVFTIGGLTELVSGGSGGWFYLALGVAWFGIATFHLKREWRRTEGSPEADT